MKGLPFVLLFTAMTFFSWGAYGPVLHHGAVGLNQDSMRAFVGVGVAYFLIAVLIPVYLLRKNQEKGKWTISGTVYSFFAGAVGAIGALGIILALGYGGKPVYVMPLVFGFAPVVNTLVTALLSRTFNQISPIFMGGIVATALGAAGVLVFKPVPVSSRPAPAASETEETLEAGLVNPLTAGKLVVFNAAPKLQEDPSSSREPQAGNAQENPDGKTDAADQQTSPDRVGESSRPADAEVVDSALAEQEDAGPSANRDTLTAGQEPQAANGQKTNQDSGAGGGSDQQGIETDGKDKDNQALKADNAGSVWGIVFSIVIAAICWGSYGPFLHIGQGKMDGSRLRPFACVGLAYFFIAVAVPLAIIYARPGDGDGAWKLAGMTWSFAAGVLGAIGALGVILAFNSGGKPYYVMPLIFGFAPVINTFISLSETDTWSLASPLFYCSLAVVIAGAVTVLTNAPKPKPKPGPAT